MSAPSVYAPTVTRNGTLARTDLTASEWRRVKAQAKRERVSASQLLGRITRDYLRARAAEGAAR